MRSAQNGMPGERRQGIFWILTVPQHEFTPFQPPGVQYIRGQLEQGHGSTGFLHWQLVVAFTKITSIIGVRSLFGPFHSELTKSSAALAYVWKEDTAIPGTRFELGTCPIARNVKRDWESIWEHAKSGDLMSIVPSVRVQSYRTLKQIAVDFMQCPAVERQCHVFWGATGTGKSRKAWGDAGLEAYSKDPRTKFWCGYRSQRHVVIDEFRGSIDVSHLLRWLDRYPVSVETKGSATPFLAEVIWITSNVDPRHWYPELDDATLQALLRRVNITHFN